MKRLPLIQAVIVLVLLAAWPARVAAPAVTPTCLRVPVPLVTVLRASLSFSAGGQLFYVRAVKSPKLHNVYFLSAQIRSPELGRKRPLGTWVVDKLQATASASPLNSSARAYSDLATPDAGTTKVTMASAGALASQKCVTRLIR
jgi:hypothetical protein